VDGLIRSRNIQDQAHSISLLVSPGSDPDLKMDMLQIKEQDGVLVVSGKAYYKLYFRTHDCTI
jgi:hypothetical protein